MPSLAVQWDRRGSFVWKVVGRRGAPRRRGDRPAAERHRRRRRASVAAGDHVVVEGLLRLREGAKVDRGRRDADDRRGRPLRPGAEPGRAQDVARGRAAPAAGEHAELTRMAKHFEDARAWLAEATKGISRFRVRRPVLAIVANLLIVVAGLAAFRGVEIRELPDVDRPVITVRAAYEGATPETIDRQVTDILEGAASRVPGVKSISSIEPLRHEPRRRRVQRIGRHQRRRERPPRRGRQRRAPAARRGRRHHHRQGRRQFRRHHAARGHRREHVDPGPDAARRGPDRRPARRRRRRRRGHGLRRPRAARARADRPERPGGARPLRRRPDDGARDASPPTRRPATSPPATSRCSCAPTRASRTPTRSRRSRSTSTTRVGDIADVIFGPAEETSTIRINGQTGIGLGIVRQAQSNTLDISAGVRAAVAELEQGLPRGRPHPRHLRRIDLHRRRADEGAGDARSRRRSSSSPSSSCSCARGAPPSSRR